MRVAGETVGSRGLALMAVTAVAGIVIGAHGWSGRQQGLPSTSLAGARSSSPAPASPGPTAASSAPATQGPRAQSPAATPAATPAPAPTPGPKLSTQSYASYSFQVWPGTPSAAAQAAETGLTVIVHRKGSGVTVSAGVAGQALPAPKYYPTGIAVYIVEASMGDDGGNSDYNLGDDGLLVTDSQGRILQ